jgi:hypothetical protein
MPTKTQMMTVAFALVAVAIINRVPQAREVLTGDTKFLGIF